MLDIICFFVVRDFCPDSVLFFVAIWVLFLCLRSTICTLLALLQMSVIIISFFPVRRWLIWFFGVGHVFLGLVFVNWFCYCSLFCFRYLCLLLGLGGDCFLLFSFVLLMV